MDHRHSEATLPSTQHSHSSRPTPNTNTSQHNSLISHSELPSSHPPPHSSFRSTQLQDQPLRTNSQRIPEIENRQPHLQQGDISHSKSQGSLSHQPDQKQAPIEKIQKIEELPFQASWGGDNLLDFEEHSSQQPNSKLPHFPGGTFSSQELKFSQFLESQPCDNLLEFNYPIDKPTRMYREAQSAGLLQKDNNNEGMDKQMIAMELQKVNPYQQHVPQMPTNIQHEFKQIQKESSSNRPPIKSNKSSPFREQKENFNTNFDDFGLQPSISENSHQKLGLEVSNEQEGNIFFAENRAQSPQQIQTIPQLWAAQNTIQEEHKSLSSQRQKQSNDKNLQPFEKKNNTSSLASLSHSSKVNSSEAVQVDSQPSLPTDLVRLQDLCLSRESSQKQPTPSKKQPVPFQIDEALIESGHRSKSSEEQSSKKINHSSNKQQQSSSKQFAHQFQQGNANEPIENAKEALFKVSQSYLLDFSQPIEQAAHIPAASAVLEEQNMESERKEIKWTPMEIQIQPQKSQQPVQPIPMEIEYRSQPAVEHQSKQNESPESKKSESSESPLEPNCGQIEKAKQDNSDQRFEKGQERKSSPSKNTRLYSISPNIKNTSQQFQEKGVFGHSNEGDKQVQQISNSRHSSAKKSVEKGPVGQEGQIQKTSTLKQLENQPDPTSIDFYIPNANQASQIPGQHQNIHLSSPESKALPVLPQPQQLDQRSVSASKHSIVDNLLSPSSKNSKDSYAIKVSEVNDELVNSHIKNNNIYGKASCQNVQQENKQTSKQSAFEIGPQPSQQQQRLNKTQERFQEQQPSGQSQHHYECSMDSRKKRKSLEEIENRAVLGGYYDAQEEKSKKAQREQQSVGEQNQKREHPSQSQKREYQKQKEESFNQASLAKPHTLECIQEAKLSFEQSNQQIQQQGQKQTAVEQLDPIILRQKLIQQLHKLLASPNSDEDRFLFFSNLISQHIDIMFLKPLSPIGSSLLQDGSTVVTLVNLLVLKQPTIDFRRSLSKYLLSVLSQKTTLNLECIDSFREELYSKKHIVHSFNEKIELKTQRKPPPSAETQTISAKKQHNHDQAQKYRSTEEKKSELNQELNQSQANYSIQVNEPSLYSGIRSIPPAEKRLLDPQTELPIKRSRIDLESSHQPKVHFTVEQQKKTKSNQRRGQSRNNNSNTKKRDQLQPVDIQLGSAYTYMELKDQHNSTFLAQVRVSRRIHDRQIKQAEATFERPKPRPSQQFRSNRKSLNTSQQSAGTPSKNQKILKRSVRKTNERSQGSQQLLNVDYIKNHFKQMQREPSTLSNFTPLSEQDKEITKLIKTLQQLDHEDAQLQQDYEQSQAVMSQSQYDYELEEATLTSRRIQQSQEVIKRQKKEIKQKLEKYYSAPVDIERVVDPNINNHGIYALLELSKRSAFIFKAKYFVTQISDIKFAPKKFIDADLQAIKLLVEEEERNNIGCMAATEQILNKIKEEESKKVQKERPSKEKYRHATEK